MIFPFSLTYVEAEKFQQEIIHFYKHTINLRKSRDGNIDQSFKLTTRMTFGDIRGCLYIYFSHDSRSPSYFTRLHNTLTLMLSLHAPKIYYLLISILALFSKLY